MASYERVDMEVGGDVTKGIDSGFKKAAIGDVISPLGLNDFYRVTGKRFSHEYPSKSVRTTMYVILECVLEDS